MGKIIRQMQQLSYCLKRSVIVDSEEKYLVFRENSEKKDKRMIKVIDVVGGHFPIYCKVFVP